MSLTVDDVCQTLTFAGKKEKRRYCNMQIFGLHRKKKDSEQKPKQLFWTQVDRCLCLLSRNLGYAIQKIVLVMVRALLVVGLCQCSLCNVTIVLAVEVLVGINAWY